MKYSAFQVLEQPRMPDSELRQLLTATSVAPWQATSVVRDLAKDLVDTRAALRERLKWMNAIMILAIAVCVLSFAATILAMRYP